MVKHFSLFWLLLFILAGTIKALERSVPLHVTDGKARIEFVPKAGEAILSSFTINPR